VVERLQRGLQLGVHLFFCGCLIKDEIQRRHNVHLLGYRSVVDMMGSKLFCALL
jgi:hypothetical protein